MIVLGVDIANMDGNRCDWAKAYAAGVRFAYLRAMFSASVDSTYANEAAAARAAGVKPGSYFFPDERVGAVPMETQVAAFAAQVQAYSLPTDLPAAFDVEYAKGTRATGRSRAELLELIVSIARLLRAALGYSPVLYSSKRVFDGDDTDTLDATHQGVDLAPLLDCPFWASRYVTDYHRAPVLGVTALPPIPAYLGDVTAQLRQTQGDAIGMTGFSHTVDIDVFYPGADAAWVERRIGASDADSVRRFQGECGLEVDGIIGLDTWARMAQRP